jgi:DNA-binding beta-propeller fold protein YncE
VFAAFLAVLAVLSAAAAAPVVDSLTAVPQTVAPGELAALTLEAHDPDCPDTCTSGCGQYVRADLTGWSATGGSFPVIDNGVSGSPYTATASWQAPDVEGTYTIDVSISDSGTFICGGRQSAMSSIDVLVTASTNEPPVVTSLVADPLQLFPGESSSLTCTGSDPEGSPLIYSWTADSGTVTPGSAGSAVFTAADPPAATVTCRVTDPEGAFAEASVLLSVVGALPEKALTAGLVAPQRLAVDSLGGVYVVDPSSGGITVLHLLSGQFVYRLSLDGATSVAVDWNDNLLVGGQTGAVVTDGAGNLVLALTSDEPLGEVADVAVDPVGRRYGVLHRAAARVVVFDEFGTKLGAFGSNGDGPDELKSPHGLAVDPAGNWLVADSGHGQIKTFDLAGTLLSTIADLGGGSGEFVQLDDVAVDSEGVIHASDSFQSWVLTFNPDGTLRESLGSYGAGTGQFKTTTGIALAPAFDRVLVGSANSSSVQVFFTTGDPVDSGPEPLADVQPPALIFDPQAVGTASVPQTVTVTNLGDAPLGIRSVRATVDFTQTHPCPFVEPGSSCNIDVEFAPTTIGVITGTLVIDTSATGPPVEIALSGVGFVPASVILSPTRLDFSDQEVGRQ